MLVIHSTSPRNMLMCKLACDRFRDKELCMRTLQPYRRKWYLMTVYTPTNDIMVYATSASPATRIRLRRSLRVTKKRISSPANVNLTCACLNLDNVAQRSNRQSLVSLLNIKLIAWCTERSDLQTRTSSVGKSRSSSWELCQLCDLTSFHAR